MSKSLFFFGPGCLLYFQSLCPRVSRYWDGSQRANCVINNRGPMQREARWVFWGRELSLSQCWIDVTELGAAPLGGASTTLQNTYTIHKEFAISFPSSHPSFPFPRCVVKDVFFNTLITMFAHQPDGPLPCVSQHPHLLLLMCPWARQPDSRRLQGCWCATDHALCPPWSRGKYSIFLSLSWTRCFL